MEMMMEEKRKELKKKKRKKNENILCAIIALMKELDKTSLEFVHKISLKRIQELDQKDRISKKIKAN